MPLNLALKSKADKPLLAPVGEKKIPEELKVTLSCVRWVTRALEVKEERKKQKTKQKTK